MPIISFGYFFGQNHDTRHRYSFCNIAQDISFCKVYLTLPNAWQAINSAVNYCIERHEDLLFPEEYLVKLRYRYSIIKGSVKVTPGPSLRDQ